MPFLRFELDALTLVPKVARSAQVAEGVIAWGLLQMWEWCWREKKLVVSPTQLRGFFGCDPSEALAAFDFIEGAEGGQHRVKGAHKNLGVAAGRSAGGHAAKGNLVPGGKRTAEGSASSAPAERQPSVSRGPAEEPARLPLGSTASSKQLAVLKERTYVSEEPAEAAQPPVGNTTAAPMPEKAPAQPAVAKAAHVPNIPTPPTTPRQEWLFPDFWAWAQFKRHQAGLVPEPAPNFSKGAAWWSTARAVAETDDLCRGFIEFGDDPFWQAKRPQLPFAGFMSQWHRFVHVRREDNHAPQ